MTNEEAAATEANDRPHRREDGATTEGAGGAGGRLGEVAGMDVEDETGECRWRRWSEL